MLGELALLGGWGDGRMLVAGGGGAGVQTHAIGLGHHGPRMWMRAGKMGVSGQGQSSRRQVLDLSLSPSSASGCLHDLGQAV